MRSIVMLVVLAANASVVRAAEATPTIAVMPFADLSGKGGKVGEALRETITNDLVEVKSVRVLERGRIDQVIAESELAAKKTSLDAIAGVRVGTLLGATLIVTGAYQQSGDTVRLTARMIRVQTGEIFGAAKVDGKTNAVLSLQDRLTGQLLLSAGIVKAPPPPKKRFTIKSWKTMEVYADAVVESDPQKRAQILARLLGEDPDFVYARRDLDALQGRMQEYSNTSNVQLLQNEQATLKKLSGSLSASDRAATQRTLFTSMIGARRFHALESAATTLASQAGGKGDDELGYALFVARVKLHKYDLALQNGESYLKAFPTGAHFRDVEGQMHSIAEVKKKRANRRAEYEADLKEKLADHKPGTLLYDHAPCICARWNNQVGPLMLDNCSAFLKKWEGRAPADEQDKIVAARFFVVLALQEMGDFAKAKPLAEKLLADSDEWDQELRTMMADWPAD